MRGILRAEPVWVEVFGGLSERQFRKLVKAARTRGGDHPVLGPPWALTPEDRVLLVAVYHRTDLTMRQLGALFGTCGGTVKQFGPHRMWRAKPSAAGSARASRFRLRPGHAPPGA